MQFNVPVVFFIFKRTEKSLQIMNRIAEIKPSKLYVVSDEGRNDAEKAEVRACREAVLNRVDWECEVIKDFADENKGCFDRIGLGALRVFEKEERAIFLEDDNMPEASFFYFCQELLEKYKDNDDVLWVCGTNYLESYDTKDNVDYVFTRHMHPCGWASWAHKFVPNYDKDFSNLTPENLKRIKAEYKNKRLFKRDLGNWKHELESRDRYGRFTSWDYQMSFSIRLNRKLGIVPRVNQIANIGADEFSIHGGSSMDMVMTQRFCGMKSLPLEFPLKHPESVEVDGRFEKLVDKIVIPPRSLTFKTKLIKNCSNIARKMLRIPADQSVHKTLRERLRGKKS